MFKKAERKQAKLKTAVTGPTGSGKTWSALRLATGLGGKIAFIDTENGSASLYAEHFDFDVLDIAPPFTTDKFITAINAAEKAGYATIVIDSLTHAWAGEGGLLEQKAALDARPNSNHWTNWGPIDKKDHELKNAFLHSSCHIIATMRSKMEYTQTQSGDKKKIEKLGLAPIQRDGLSYEFSVVFDIGMDHKAEVSKDRTHLFDDSAAFQITEETGKLLANFLNSGKEVDFSRPEPPKTETKATAKPPTKPVPYTGNPAEYVVKVGKKYVGQAFKDMQPTEIDGFAQWIVDDAKKKDKAISPEFQEFVDVADKYLESIGFFPPKDPPPLNTNEVIN